MKNILFILGISILVGISIGLLTKEEKFFYLDSESGKNEITESKFYDYSSRGSRAGMYTSVEEEFNAANALIYGFSTLGFLLVFSVFYKKPYISTLNKRKIIAREFLYFIASIIFYLIILFSWIGFCELNDDKYYKYQAEYSELLHDDNLPYRLKLIYFQKNIFNIIQEFEYTRPNEKLKTDLDDLVNSSAELEFLEQIMDTVVSSKYFDFMKNEGFIAISKSEFQHRILNDNSSEAYFTKIEEVGKKKVYYDEISMSFCKGEAGGHLLRLGLFIFTIIFIFRYLFYAIKWSVKQLKIKEAPISSIPLEMSGNIEVKDHPNDNLVSHEKNEILNLKELILDKFGIELPIKGGSGNSIEDPIILERKGLNNYVGLEYEILKYVGILRGVEWKRIEQKLIDHNERSIDKIKIETKKNVEGKLITQIENYYFDFTECLNSYVPDSNTTDSEELSNESTDKSNKYNLIESFFYDYNECLNWFLLKKDTLKANDDGKCIAQLKKEDGYLRYTLTWLDNNYMVGDYVKVFKPTEENIIIFNNGCKIIAERLAIYLDTNDMNAVPSEPPAFGILTHTR